MAEKMSLDARYAADEYVRLAGHLGVELEKPGLLVSEELLNEVLSGVKEKVKNKMREDMAQGKEWTFSKSDPQDLIDAYMNLKEEIKHPNKENTNEGAANQSLSVDALENAQAEENTDTKWMEEKRNFWQKYAGDHNYLLENNKETDEQNKTCSFSLSKDNQKYDLVYTEPTKAFIGENAPLDLYQGLVQEAAQGNMSITFGEHLSDTQKAMLYAAVLSAGEKGPQMVNPPEIDMNADYFKALPDDVKKVIEDAQKAKEEAAKEGAQKEEPAKEEPAKEEPAKEEPAKEGAQTVQTAGKQKIDAMREKLAKHQQLNASRGLPTALTKPVDVSKINTSALKLMKDQKQAQK